MLKDPEGYTPLVYSDCTSILMPTFVQFNPANKSYVISPAMSEAPNVYTICVSGDDSVQTSEFNFQVMVLNDAPVFSTGLKD